MNTQLPRVEHVQDGDAVVLRPVGEFDIATADLLRSASLDAVTPACSQVVVDLSATTFLDSMSLGVLVGLSRHVQGRGGWVRLVAPLPNVRTVLRITGLDDALGVYDDVDGALGRDRPAVHDLGPEPEFA